MTINSTMQTEKERPFKVLIAGGSIAGLTLANALARANIDFLVLESHGRIDPSVGAALTVPTNACRILDQMGIYDDIQAHIQPTADIYTYVEDGRLLAIMDMPRVIWERYACLFLLCSGLDIKEADDRVVILTLSLG
jgi:2-polyprenyl-6-methoxyphenol hydroxylase-like FAD-dependent oxidoreductase